MIHGTRALSGSILLVLMAAYGMDQTPAEANGPARFVAGELLVKFKDASDYGKRIVQAMPRGERPPDIERLAGQLSTELNVPLTAVRVTSGRELLLQIDREALAQRLTEQVQTNRAVRAVRVAPAAQAVLPAAVLTVIVDLVPESDEHKQLSKAVKAGHPQGREIDGLARRLAAEFQPQPTGAVNEQGQLLLIVSIADLTQDLVARLQRRTDVDYAQVSHVIKPFGDTNPRP